MSQGKGWDLGAATASAVMESIESYHAGRIRLPLKLATCRELRACGYRVADVPLTRRGTAIRQSSLEAASHAICEAVERDAEFRRFNLLFARNHAQLAL